jgi:nucleoside-diphosphate-sugar epimerase
MRSSTRGSTRAKPTEVSRRALVTGAGGFVGAGITRRLVEQGHEVTALVGIGGDLWRLGDLVGSIQPVEVDLREPDAVTQAFLHVRPEWVFHLAAHGGYSWQTDRRRIFDSNLLGTINVLEAVQDVGSEIALIAGSSSEYGIKDHAPAESEPLEPNSDYAVAKAAATLLACHLGREHGLPVATLRLSSVFGPFEQPGRFIPTRVAHALRGELPPLVDPSIARVFVYLDDVVDAFLLAAERGVTPGDVFNVGTGVETTIAAAVDSARRTLGVEATPQWGSMNAREWDTQTWVGDPARIRSALGWSPAVSFDDGLARTAEWLRARTDLWQRYGLD